MISEIVDTHMNEQGKRNKFNSAVLGKILVYAILIGGAAISMFPFLWMISTSLMSLGEAMGSTMIPSELHWSNYIEAWEGANFALFFKNSVVITLITLAGELSISILAAYAFARMDFPGKNALFGLLLSTMMIPGMVFMIPNLLTVTWLGRVAADFFGYVVELAKLTLAVLALVSTRYVNLDYKNLKSLRDKLYFVVKAALILTILAISLSVLYSSLRLIFAGQVQPLPWIDNWPALTIPFMGSVFSIFLLRQFFAQIPQELFDAARIDGAGHFRFLIQVVLPLSTAPIMVIIVLSFIGSWNALAWPLLVTNTETWRPIAVGLLRFISDEGSKVHLIMAGSFITIIPILILYFFTQKQFTESIARSGLKG